MLLRWHALVLVAAPLALLSVSAHQSTDAGDSNRGSGSASHIQNAFSAGWMLQDTNGDGVVDFINGKIVVPAQPTAAENTAAANLAARLAFGSTGLTPPLVVPADEDKGDGPRIWVGKSALPSSIAAQASTYLQSLKTNEGGIFAAGGNLMIVATDDAGLLAASDAYAARAPYIWKVPGDDLSRITAELNRTAGNVGPEFQGLVYEKGKAGVARAFLTTNQPVTTAQLQAVLNSPHLTSVHEVVVRLHGADVTATNSKPLPAIVTPADISANPAASAGEGTAPPAAGPANSSETEGQTPQPLDLATVYTSKGLFKGTPKMPIPSSLDAQLLVPAGRAGRC